MHQCGEGLEMMVNDLNNKRLAERKYLIKIMKCICFVARQGLAFRGNDSNDNLTQLFKLFNKNYYLTLYQNYITKILEKHSDIHQCLEEIIDTNTATMNENSTLVIKDTHNKIKSVLLSLNFRTLQSNFDESLKNEAQSFRNYMKVFEHLLLFLLATRQQISTLHLTALHALSRYFLHVIR